MDGKNLIYFIFGCLSFSSRLWYVCVIALRLSCALRWRWRGSGRPTPKILRVRTKRWRRSGIPAARRWVLLIHCTSKYRHCPNFIQIHCIHQKIHFKRPHYLKILYPTNYIHTNNKINTALMIKMVFAFASLWNIKFSLTDLEASRSAGG